MEKPYLKFLENLFGLTESQIKPGCESVVDNLLQTLKEHDGRKFTNSGIPLKNEHLYEIIRLWCGFDGKPFSMKKIGCNVDLHGGDVISRRKVQKKIAKGFRILRHPVRMRIFYKDIVV